LFEENNTMIRQWMNSINVSPCH